MPTFSFDQQLRVPDEVLYRELDGEAVLLHLGSEEYFGLDSVGAEMWRALTAGATIQEAFVGLMNTYDVTAEQLRTDMQEFIDKLIAAELVEVTPAHEKT